MSKYAIVFPGIGYHSDKPLLYFAKKLAKEMGYQIIEVNYSGFSKDIRGNAEKMKATFELAIAQAEEILDSFPIDVTDDILCISKSIGTVVASVWQKKKGLVSNNIYFTPVAETFDFIRLDSGIVFHGTKDPWVETDFLLRACEKLYLPVYLTSEANHSLEIGDTDKDLLSSSQLYSSAGHI